MFSCWTGELGLESPGVVRLGLGLEPRVGEQHTMGCPPSAATQPWGGGNSTSNSTNSGVVGARGSQP